MHRLTAVLAVVLVVALNLLAVMPALHARLHAGKPENTKSPCKHHGCGNDAHPAGADDCAVVKFAHGHGGLVVPVVIVGAPLRFVVAMVVIADDFSAPSLTFRLPPGCGPPAV